MASLSTLQIRIAHRPYESLGSAFKSARTFCDFVIDGQSLADIFRTRGFDLISVLCIDAPENLYRAATQRLLWLQDADGPNDRRTLYVSAECGDIGCGAITVLVGSAAVTFTGKEFGYENNYEPGVSHEKVKDLGPFVFSRHEYSRVLNDNLSKMEAAS
jgi:hypothetical protein